MALRRALKLLPNLTHGNIIIDHKKRASKKFDALDHILDNWLIVQNVIVCNIVAHEVVALC